MPSLARYLDLYNPSLELIILVITLVINGVLTLAVYRSNPNGATNKIFSLLSLFTMLWLMTNFFVRLPLQPESLLLLHRLGIFFAAAMSSLFFLLAHTMPAETIQLKQRTLYIVLALTLLMMAINLSPYAFVSLNNVGENFEPQAGPGLAFFSILSTIFSILAVYWLIKKYRRSEGVEKNQLGLVLLGILTMLGLIIVTVLTPIIFLHSSELLMFTPLYTLAFLGMTGYAIVKYRLFNLKVLATEAFTTILWIALLSKTVSAESSTERFIDFFIFAIAFFFGIFLIRSVRREVEQREQLQVLTTQLKEANVKLEELSKFKSQLLSIASHQIQSPLAAMKGFAQLVMDGSYGPVSDQVKDAVGKMKHSADNLIDLIGTLLDVRKIDEGRMEYKFAPTDIVKLVIDVVDQFRPLALAKKLAFTALLPKKELMVNADAQKLRQVIQNLIDNAIKYTSTGFVKVELYEANDAMMFTVSDSGAGFAPELAPHLFEEFVRDERVKRQILGTGLGLYIAKKMIEAHGGKVWGESKGPEKGSTFFVTLKKI